MILMKFYLRLIRNLNKSVCNAEKCIIFCRTYDDAVSIHERTANALGEKDCLFIDGNPTCVSSVSSWESSFILGLRATTSKSTSSVCILALLTLHVCTFIETSEE